MYWKRGWQLFLQPRYLLRNLVVLARPVRRMFCAQSLHLAARPGSRARPIWLIMWGCILAAAITFPLVFGWIHFETVAGRLRALPRRRLRISDVLVSESSRCSGFLIFHGLVWSSFLVIAGVMLAMRRRMRDRDAAALQPFGEDIMPLVLLFADQRHRADAGGQLRMDARLRVRIPGDPARGHGDRHARVAAVRQVLSHLSAAGPAGRVVLQGRRTPQASRRTVPGAATPMPRRCTSTI